MELKLKAVFEKRDQEIEKALKERLEELGYTTTESLQGKKLNSRSYPVHTFGSDSTITHSTCTEYLIDDVEVLRLTFNTHSVPQGDTVKFTMEVEKL